MLTRVKRRRGQWRRGPSGTDSIIAIVACFFFARSIVSTAAFLFPSSYFYFFFVTLLLPRLCLPRSLQIFNSFSRLFFKIYLSWIKGGCSVLASAPPSVLALTMEIFDRLGVHCLSLFPQLRCRLRCVGSETTLSLSSFSFYTISSRP